MDNREKEILEQLDEKARNVDVPESLSPESIEKMLSEYDNKGKKKKKNYWLPGAVAACLVLVGGSAILLSALNHNQVRIQSERPFVGGGNNVDLLASASDYDEIYRCLQTSEKTDIYVMEESAGASGETAMESSEATSAMAKDVGASGYSDTNVREEGVGEADIVKTDGTYLFIRKENQKEIEIVDTRGEEMKSVAKIGLDVLDSISEIYVQDEKLIVMGVYYKDNNVEGIEDSFHYGYYGGFDTVVITYEISNPEEPKEIGRVMQSGNYSSSRVVDGYVYVFSLFYPDVECRKNEITGYIPFVDGDAVNQSKILLPAGKIGNQFMVITSISLEDPEAVVDSKAVFTKGGESYVSGNNIYIYEQQSKYMVEEWEQSYNTQTAVRKISYSNGELEGEAQAVVPGYLDSSFCIDEYEGYLRMVVTVDTDRTTTSAVYVMNEDLNLTGKIEGLAEEERVYSARFMGETGYFVTFRETDPLFSVDLSDPTNPQIIGKLKIPGFSEYLHAYDGNLLLGIGMDVDEDTQVTGGIKLSMFDISDPSNVKEVDTYVIEGSYGSELFYDYKAVLVDAQRDVIGFSTSGYNEIYHVFGYGEDGFYSKMEEEVNGSSYGSTRGVYINDTLYIIKGNIVEAYDMVTFEKKSDLIL